jgi:hypothetical protein
MLSLLILAGLKLAERAERRRAARYFAEVRARLAATLASADTIAAQHDADRRLVVVLEKHLYGCAIGSSEFRRLAAELAEVRGRLKRRAPLAGFVRKAELTSYGLDLAVAPAVTGVVYGPALGPVETLVAEHVAEPVRSILLDSVPHGGRGKQLNDLRAHYGLRPLTRREIGAEAEASPGFWQFIDKQTEKVEAASAEPYACASPTERAYLERLDRASGYTPQPCGRGCGCVNRCAKPCE